MNEETGIYREEVMVMMGVRADITVNTRDILTILRGEEDDEEAEEDDA